MKEFRSKLEELMEAEELLFPATPGFGNTYKKFLGQATAHPAKMNTQLLEFLIDTFTVEGESVLDPMSGSGSTGVVAALHGRNAVCVELEKKFFKWMEQARRKVETQQTLAWKGKIRNVLGDARQLSTLLKEADVVVTSPPYAMAGEHRIGYNHKAKDERRGHKPYQGFREGYSDDPENIGNLRHGKVDVVVTSPPYSETINTKSGGMCGYANKGEFKVGISTRTAREYSKSENNIGNLKKETYLEAMLTVYQQMHSVLKPNGKAIIIIKPFIRNKKVVDLPYQTWLLLKQAGFKLAQLFKLRLKQQSFWRILYHRKFPKVAQIKHEYVLVTEKLVVASSLVVNGTEKEKL